MNTYICWLLLDKVFHHYSPNLSIFQSGVHRKYSGVWKFGGFQNPKTQLSGMPVLDPSRTTITFQERSENDPFLNDVVHRNMRAIEKLTLFFISDKNVVF